MESLSDVFGEVISSYSREQAMEDGLLVDVSNVAREAGFKYPVAMTRTVWGKYVEVPEGVELQDEAGRLWDIVWMLKMGIRKSVGSPEIMFQLLVRNDNKAPKKVTLKAMCGPGDDAAPVITVMLPEED